MSPLLRSPDPIGRPELAPSTATIAATILTRLALPTETLPTAPARGPPQLPIWPGALDPPPDLDAFDPA